MSLINLTIPPHKANGIRDAFRQMISGRIDVGPVFINLPDTMVITKRVVDGDHLEFTWDDNPEIVLPGVDPDIVKVRCWPHLSIIDMHISNIRIDHPGD